MDAADTAADSALLPAACTDSACTCACVCERSGSRPLAVAAATSSASSMLLLLFVRGASRSASPSPSASPALMSSGLAAASGSASPSASMSISALMSAAAAMAKVVWLSVPTGLLLVPAPSEVLESWPLPLLPSLTPLLPPATVAVADAVAVAVSVAVASAAVADDSFRERRRPGPPGRRVMGFSAGSALLAAALLAMPLPGIVPLDGSTLFWARRRPWKCWRQPSLEKP